MNQLNWFKLVTGLAKCCTRWKKKKKTNKQVLKLEVAKSRKVELLAKSQFFLNPSAVLIIIT